MENIILWKNYKYVLEQVGALALQNYCMLVLFIDVPYIIQIVNRAELLWANHNVGNMNQLIK